MKKNIGRSTFETLRAVRVQLLESRQGKCTFLLLLLLRVRMKTRAPMYSAVSFDPMKTSTVFMDNVRVIGYTGGRNAP